MRVDVKEQKNVVPLRPVIVTESSDNISKHDSFPIWLKEIYPDTLKWKYQNLKQEITNFRKVNDSIVLINLRRADFTCAWEYLVVLTNRKPTDSVEVGQICDQDLAYYQYEHKVHKEIDPLKFEVITIAGTVPDSMLNGKWIKGNKDFYDLAMSDTFVETIEIWQTGKIQRSTGHNNGHSK